MNILAIAVVLLLMSMAPWLAFVIGVLLIGVHIGQRRRPLTTTYTRTQDRGTLGHIAQELEDLRHEADRY